MSKMSKPKEDGVVGAARWQAVAAIITAAIAGVVGVVGIVIGVQAKEKVNEANEASDTNKTPSHLQERIIELETKVSDLETKKSELEQRVQKFERRRVPVPNPDLEIHGEPRNSCARDGGLQICWGILETKRHPDGHVRTASGTFRQPFAGPPILMMNIDCDNPSKQGPGFVEYGPTQSTEEKFQGSFVEVQNRGPSCNGNVRWMAIGRSRQT
jgi:hypothetical protein